MTRAASTLLALMLGLTSTAPALAGSEQGFEIGLGLGALGDPVVEGRYRLSNRVAVRIPVGLSTDPAADDAAAEAGYSIGGLGFVADYAPGGGNLTLSGGAVLPVQARGEADVAGDLSNGFSQDAGLSPMLALSYGRSFASGWTVSTNLGAVLTGIGSAGGGQADLASDAADTGASIVPHLRLEIDLRF